MPLASWLRVEPGHRGAKSFRFYARLGRHSLRPGLYQLIALPQNGRTQSVPFRIVG